MSISVRKIALLSGCAVSTVSRVLSGNYGNVRVSKKTREKILELCKEFDYVPNVNASRLFSNKTRIIGLLCPISQYGFSDPNLSQFISAVYDTITEHGYRLQFISMNSQPVGQGRELALFKRKEIDGLIIWGIYGDTEWLYELKSKEYPYILASNRCGSHPAVSCDEEFGMCRMIEHCQSMGANSFVYVDGPDVDISQRRREAFSLYEQGRCRAVLKTTTFGYEGGYALAQPVLEVKPDAVICANDMLATGLIQALQESGVSIPRDIMVTGADNIPASEYIFPALTTYDQQARICGTRCAQQMLARLDTGAEIASEAIQPVIKIRRSTARSTSDTPVV